MGLSPVLILLAALVRPVVAEPSWVKDSEGQQLHARTLEIICVGDGPSQDLARKDAMNSCFSSARQYLKTEQKVKSLTVETEDAVAFHQEIEEHVAVSGLVCKPKKESFESKADSTKVWLKCEYDLSKAVVVAAAPSGVPETEASSHQNIVNRRELQTLSSSSAFSGTRRIESSNRMNVTVYSVPPCASILIRGSRSRIVKCSANPITFGVSDYDLEAIVRAPGYLPKTVKIPKTGGYNEPIQVMLDRM